MGLRPTRKNFDVFVVLSITLMKGRDCANEFNIKAFECENNFDVIRQGKVYSCVPVFNFVSALLGGANTECLN